MQIVEVSECPNKCKWKPLRFQDKFYAYPKDAGKNQIRYEDADENRTRREDALGLTRIRRMFVIKGEHFLTYHDSGGG
jgi:hypothetical protein